ncbi:MAG: DNA/RNA non-specific endonuclease [Rikenellaceae bacterium]
MRKYILITTLLLMWSNICWAQYEPTTSGERVTHTYFCLDYNEEHEQANWVYYTLSPQNITGEAERTNTFRIDPKVSTRSASTSDYTKSGYDRGHLCPAADMSHNEVAMKESFYMSNMSPQAPSLNRGKWKSLEELVREWCKTKGELHITVGGVLKDGLPQIGANGVSVPESYYKVIYSVSDGEMIGFIMPNEKLELAVEEYATTIDNVEELIGIDLYPQLNDSIKESRIDLSKWDF